MASAKMNLKQKSNYLSFIYFIYIPKENQIFKPFINHTLT